MILGYVHNRINFSFSEQQEQLLNFSKLNGHKIDIVHSNIDIDELCSSMLSDGDVLVVSEILCLGSSLQVINDRLKNMTARNIKVLSAKEKYVFDKNNAYLLEGIDLAINIRNSMVSSKTSAALEDRKQKGFSHGLKKGAVLRKKLDGNLIKIKKMIEQGYSKPAIAKELGVCLATVYNFLKLNPGVKDKTLVKEE